MLEELKIANFKLFDEQGVTIRPGKITILIGVNGTGKSSVLHALFLLKNSNGTTHLVTSGPGLNLGSFEDVVHLRETDRRIMMGLSVSYSDFAIAWPMNPPFPTTGRYNYDVEFSQDGTVSRNRGKIGDLDHELFGEWTPQNEFVRPKEWDFLGGSFKITFSASSLVSNPITVGGTTTAHSTYSVPIPPAPEKAEEINNKVNRLLTTVRQLLEVSDFISVVRGFTQKGYHVYEQLPTPAHMSGSGPDLQAGAIANLLLYDPDLANDIVKWLKMVLPDREIRGLRPRLQNGPTAAVELLTDRQRINLINEAFGLNQITVALAQIASIPAGAVIGIEEPEIHLHPRAQAALTGVFTEIAVKGQKQLILTTHSEHILMGFLSAVARGELSPDDLAVYEFRREGTASRVERLEVNSYGQIEGGLRGFMEVDLHELDDLVKARFRPAHR